jgi:hypothetical protein
MRIQNEVDESARARSPGHAEAGEEGAGRGFKGSPSAADGRQD